MPRTATVTQAEINRAIKVAERAGLTVQEIVLEPRRVRIVTAGVAANRKAGNDDGPKEWPSDG